MSAIQSLVTKARQYPRALAATGLMALGAGSYYGYDTTNYISAKEAITRGVGSEVRLKMEVGDARFLGPRIGTLINDVPYRTDPEGKNRVTVRVPGKDASALVGKTIHVVGTVDEYQGKKQVVAESVDIQ
jgi:hypothetical protein